MTSIRNDAVAAETDGANTVTVSFLIDAIVAPIIDGAITIEHANHTKCQRDIVLIFLLFFVVLRWVFRWWMETFNFRFNVSKLKTYSIDRLGV